MTKRVLIDVPNCVHRAYHAMKGHSNLDNPISYAFFRDLANVWLVHRAPMVFCFDDQANPPCRRKVLPQYKANREPNPIVNEALTLLQGLLTEAGFANVLCLKHYEADDLIGLLCKHRNPDDQYVLVSNDTDLYQLIGNRVWVWNHYTRSEVKAYSVEARLGVKPKDYVTWKALVGDTSDNIRGVAGIGEKRAAQYVRGELNEKAVRAIENEWERVEFNKALITVPFSALQEPESLRLEDDRVSREVWDDMMRMLRIESLLGKAPVA